MTSKLFNFLLPELQVAEAEPMMAALPPKVTSLDIELSSPMGNYPGYYPLRPALSYQDVIRCSGMSWSKMLQETSKHEFREFSRESQRAMSRSHQQLNTYGMSPQPDEVLAPPPPFIKSHQQLLPQHSLIIKPTQYNWVRTEDLDKKPHGTDRPYRNTYGDKSAAPSKLFLSTELPTIPQEGELLANADGSAMYNKNRWVANRQIERIYSLLHSDPKHANKVHIITRRESSGKGNSLPIILPHFYVQLSKSINQVMKEDQPEVDRAVSQTRRPMTSEKFNYKPLPQQPCNPELIMSNKGQIVIRDKKPLRRQHKSAETYNKMRLKPRAESKTTTYHGGASSGGDGRVTPSVSVRPPTTSEHRIEHSISASRRPAAVKSAAFDTEFNSKQLSARKRPILGKATPRPAVAKSAAGVENLQSADGFVFSVKITPKTPRGPSAADINE